jgi:two-component system sensor histidine kinase ChvG
MTAVPHPNLNPQKAERPGDVLLGEDWVSPNAMAEVSAGRKVRRGGIFVVERSPLARKIILFNLLALVMLVSGVLFFNPFRDSLVNQHDRAMVNEANLIAGTFEAGLPADGSGSVGAIALDLAALPIGLGVEIFLFDDKGALVSSATGSAVTAELGPQRKTYITDFLNFLWRIASLVFGGAEDGARPDSLELVQGLLQEVLQTQKTAKSESALDNGETFAVAAPIMQGARAVGAVALVSAQGDINRLVRHEREQILQMFVIALLVSIGLSLVLASTIANPLSDLAEAAELGQNRDARRMRPGRIRIPDLTARPDEIGRLSVAMRGMVAALYERIESNEQFAADVSHEIKNPLASLRSAVGSLRMVKKEEHREKLLDVIEHDVRRLDRLVSDISNASRLDAELVKEEEETFDLMHMLGNLAEHLGNQARAKGVEFITDFPPKTIQVNGLEARLAQVFVNLITNAISFCEEGDAVRLWVRKRENRVLIVVEDTGPGIPEPALKKVFKRFYSDRPVTHFGNNSGLGLSISKQIVEAHAGVIWAENIRPTQADLSSEPLGARFVVGLPV